MAEITRLEAQSALLDRSARAEKVGSTKDSDFFLKLEGLIAQQHKEAEYWKKAAAYLADCHAATAEQECGLKSVSKTKKKRYRDICKLAADMLQGRTANTATVHGMLTPDERVKRSGSRCMDVWVNWEAL